MPTRTSNRSGARPGRVLHIVSGKGGTGKTTVAAAMACALATEGRRVLLCEVEGRQGIAELFEMAELQPGEERRLCRTPAGGQVYGLAVDAESALMEYLDTFYRLGLAGKALDRFGVFDFATSIAPGLRDVLLTGKVYEAVRRGAKGRRDAYDAVVLDAPPTGRIAHFLNVHEAVAGLAKVGPIRNQADSIIHVFRSGQTAVHLVTVAEDMPVTETLEAIEDLRPTRITVASIVCNMVTESELDDDELDRAVRGQLALTVPGLDETETRALGEELAVEAAWIREERECLTALEEADLPMARLPLDHGGVDQATVLRLADSLVDQIGSELPR